MEYVARDPTTLSFSYPSYESAAFFILDKVESFIKERTPAEATKVLLVLRELLVNAIVHGNKKNPRRFVNIRVTDLGDDSFSAEVEDEGNGFDYAQIEARLPKRGPGIGQHGYLLIKALVDGLEFDEGGRRVVATVSLDRVESGVSSRESDGNAM
jgi:anti-sigma regulatory factor (Ser/Thr protein kinase)